MNNKINLSIIVWCMIIVLPVMALMLTPLYKLSVLIPPMVLVAALSVTRRQNINIIFYIIIFLIPFGAYRKVGPINIPWILALLVLAVAVFDLIQGKLNLRLLKGKIWYYLLPLFFVNLLATYLSDYQETAFKAMINWVAAYLFVGLMILLITERGVFRDIPGWIIASVSLGSLLAVTGVYLGIWADLFTAEGRGKGGAPDPNNMCMMIIFVLPMVLHYLIYAKTKSLRFAFSIIFIINLFAIVSTNSRSGMLVAGVILFLLVLVHMAKMRARYIGVVFPIFLSFALALPVLMPQKALKRLQTLTATTQDKSVQRRGAYVEVGLRAFMKRPIIGYGPFTFQHVFAESRESRKYKREGVAGEELRQAHNTYLEILVGSGVLGLFFFMGAIFQAHLNFDNARKLLNKINKPEQSHLILSFQFAFVGALIYLSVFSDPYHKYLLIMLPLSELALRYTNRMLATLNQQKQL